MILLGRDSRPIEDCEWGICNDVQTLNELRQQVLQCN